MSGRPLRAYMAYSRGEHPEDGAVLVFAHTAREARLIAYPYIAEWTGGGYIDTAVRWLKDGAEHLRKTDEPHVVDDPPGCIDCQLWFAEPYDAAGRCEGCAEMVDGAADSLTGRGP